MVPATDGRGERMNSSVDPSQFSPSAAHEKERSVSCVGSARPECTRRADFIPSPRATEMAPGRTSSVWQCSFDRHTWTDYWQLSLENKDEEARGPRFSRKVAGISET